MNWLGEIFKSFFNMLTTIFKWSIIFSLVSLICLTILYSLESIAV